jgi:D-alanyl-D-alanine carboxypeptidase/D-alanyl-D-alanine-endopeptidase (penicillin-binding protein 4)
VKLTVRPGPAISSPAVVELPPFSPFSSVDSTISTRAADGKPASIVYERMPGSDRLAMHGSIPKDAEPSIIEAACPDPGAWFAALLRRALESNGISIQGTNYILSATEAVARPREGWNEIGRVDSPALSEIANLILKPSQNLYAQMLLLEIGADTERMPRAGEPFSGDNHEQAGLHAMQKFLGTAGIAAGDVQLDEGSGLSRRNVVTPRAVVQLLRHMRKSAVWEAWQAALPIGGVDGTLQSRFTQGASHGRVRAKTGSLRGVHALAGYVPTAGGQTFAFTIYGNQLAGSQGGVARKTIDRFVEQMAEFAGKIDN